MSLKKRQWPSEEVDRDDEKVLGKRLTRQLGAAGLCSMNGCMPSSLMHIDKAASSLFRLKQCLRDPFDPRVSNASFCLPISNEHCNTWPIRFTYTCSIPPSGRANFIFLPNPFCSLISPNGLSAAACSGTGGFLCPPAFRGITSTFADETPYVMSSVAATNDDWSSMYSYYRVVSCGFTAQFLSNPETSFGRLLLEPFQPPQDLYPFGLSPITYNELCERLEVPVPATGRVYAQISEGRTPEAHAQLNAVNSDHTPNQTMLKFVSRPHDVTALLKHKPIVTNTNKGGDVYPTSYQVTISEIIGARFIPEDAFSIGAGCYNTGGLNLATSTYGNVTLDCMNVPWGDYDWYPLGSVFPVVPQGALGNGTFDLGTPYLTGDCVLQRADDGVYTATVLNGTPVVPPSTSAYTILGRAIQNINLPDYTGIVSPFDLCTYWPGYPEVTVSRGSGWSYQFSVTPIVPIPVGSSINIVSSVNTTSIRPNYTSLNGLTGCFGSITNAGGCNFRIDVVYHVEAVLKAGNRSAIVSNVETETLSPAEVHNAIRESQSMSSLYHVQEVPEERLVGRSA